MTTVSFTQVTALESLFVWIDEARSSSRRTSVYPPGVDPDLEERTGDLQHGHEQDRRVDRGAAGALRLPRGTRLRRLDLTGGRRLPAEGELFVGDLVVSIDGRPVASGVKHSGRSTGCRSDEVIAFRVRAGGEVHEVELRRGSCQGASEPLVGISMIDSFPFEIEIASGDVGGPSAGLMFSLGLYDALTPDDLTGGRTIAGTGTLTPDGDVGADRRHRRQGDRRRAGGSDASSSCRRRTWRSWRASIPATCSLISVATFDDAVEALEALCDLHRSQRHALGSRRPCRPFASPRPDDAGPWC